MLPECTENARTLCASCVERDGEQRIGGRKLQRHDLGLPQFISNRYTSPP